MATQTFDGQLEIDSDRGVIYFHSSKNGQTLLRICRLPTPIPSLAGEVPEMLDITNGYGCSWRGVPSRLSLQEAH